MTKQIELLKTKNKEEKKHFNILGYSVWRILAYFIIYSVIGYFIETLYGIARYGTLESRQSFLYGPFCAIYGIGAIVIIILLQYFKKNYNTLFIGGCLVGSILEYIISWIGEVILNVKWWDYSNMPLNLNGRICLMYSLFWGFLSLYLMISLNPKIDKLIDWIKSKFNIRVIKLITTLLIIFMILDFFITSYAIMCFMVRMIKEKNVKVSNIEQVNSAYNIIYSNENQKNIIYKYFGNEKMIKTFPRLKVEDTNGNIIFFSDLLPDIKPYYFKFKNIKKELN